MAPHRRNRPDPSTADRLIAGRVGAEDAPPGYRRVAALLGDAGRGFPDVAGPAEATTVSAMVDAIHGAPAPEVASRRSGMLSKVLAAKTIAVVSVLALSASGAAAATGNLPDSVQGKVAKAAKHVGVNLPDGKGVDRVNDAQNCPSVDTPVRNRGQYLKAVRESGDAAALETAKKSRCGMPINSKGTPGTDEAGEAPETEEAPENPGKSGEPHGKAGENPGKADEDHGAPAETPAPVETPNPGGAGTGGDASDGANSNGAENADPAAGDGSANAEDHPTPENLPTPDGLPVPGAGS